MKNESCIYWSELDNVNGSLFEHCKASCKRCFCSATKKECSYPKLFKNGE